MKAARPGTSVSAITAALAPAVLPVLALVLLLMLAGPVAAGAARPAADPRTPSPASWVTAGIVLATAAVILGWVRRRGVESPPELEVGAGPGGAAGRDEEVGGAAGRDGAAGPRPDAVAGDAGGGAAGRDGEAGRDEEVGGAADPDDASPPASRLAAIEATGEAMIDAGYSVATVRLVLEDMARVNGFPHAEIVVFPTALFVSVRGVGELRTGAVSSGHSRLTLGQIDDLDDVVNDVRRAPTDPAAVIRRIQEIRAARSPYTSTQRVIAYGFLSAAISVMLGASWGGLASAAILGVLVGVALQYGQRVQQRYQALVTVGVSFGVSTAVLALSTLGSDASVLPALIAPLVILLPGGLLTTGVLELATGQMMAGAGRLAAGAMQLILLAAGVVAASALVGVPELDLTGPSQPLGPLAPWLAVPVFGAGVVVHQSGRRRSIGWVILVLYVAYGAQVAGDAIFGGVLSAFIGAFAMTPAAALVSRLRSGPAEFVTFLPGFWLLVPGALGLVGVAYLLGGDDAGFTTLVTTASTMVAIALGILAGGAVSSGWATPGAAGERPGVGERTG